MEGKVKPTNREAGQRDVNPECSVKSSLDCSVILYFIDKCKDKRILKDLLQ